MNKKQIRETIFQKYNGLCAYCGEELGEKWHIDHIEPVVRDLETGVFEKPENDSIENLNPSCPSCNIQKNSYTVEQFRRNIQKFLKSLIHYSTQYKFVRKYGLIKETGIEAEFYFETIQKNKTVVIAEDDFFPVNNIHGYLHFCIEKIDYSVLNDSNAKNLEDIINEKGFFADMFNMEYLGHLSGAIKCDRNQLSFVANIINEYLSNLKK